MITKYKDREVDLEKPVEMYRCLNRKGRVYSIRQDGKVVGHTKKIVLKNCDFIVNKSGKIRCRTTQERNVHAYVRGYVGTINDIKSVFSFGVCYKPFTNLGFHIFTGDYATEISKADIIYTQDNHLVCQI
jgi:hypothetical protein